MLVGRWAAGTDAQRERWLEAAITGEARIAVAFEDQDIVAHAASADLLIVERGGVGYCVPIAEATVTEERSVDRARELGRVAFEAPAAAAGRWLPAIRLPGNDLYLIEIDAPNWLLCRMACTEDSRCGAWTYRGPTPPPAPLH